MINVYYVVCYFKTKQKAVQKGNCHDPDTVALALVSDSILLGFQV